MSLPPSNEKNPFSNVRSKMLSYEQDVLSPQDNPTSNSTSQAANTKKTASISVADCLACSGCVTTAEAVLLTTQHSIKTLRKFCTPQSSKKIVFTVSPAVIADLTGNLYSSQQCLNKKVADRNALDVARKLTSFLCEEFHAHTVLDGNIPQRISLLHSAIEFCHRYTYISKLQMNEEAEKVVDYAHEAGLYHHDERQIPTGTPSIALSSSQTRYLVRGNENDTQPVIVRHDAGRDSRITGVFQSDQKLQEIQCSLKKKEILPMLASSCPGFVCYVEKTASDVIPNLCTVRSPMSIAGLIYKHNLLESTMERSSRKKVAAEEEGFRTDNKKDRDRTLSEVAVQMVRQADTQVYHVAIMPCYDKKLEAERKDFAWEQYNEQEEKFTLEFDTDLVITSSELMFVLNNAAAMNTKSETTIKESMNEENQENIAIVRSYFDSLPLAPTASWDTLSDNYSGGVFITTRQVRHRQHTEETSIESSDTPISISSGGYAEFIFRFASKALYNHEIPSDKPLPWKPVARHTTNNTTFTNAIQRRRRHGRGLKDNSISDFSEVILYRKDGAYTLDVPLAHSDNNDVVLRFALAYGFKNVQLIMQHMAESTSSLLHDYHYFEMMACPSGCLNGGGQISNHTNKKETPSETKSRVLQNMTMMDRCWQEGVNQQSIATRQDIPISTRYHVVPKIELSTGATAGVTVEDTKW